VSAPGIVAFLRARLDEDEACEAAFPEAERTWIAAPGSPRVETGDGFDWVSKIPPGVIDCDDPDDDCSDYAGLAWRQQAHIARHDPARVLADVMAVLGPFAAVHAAHPDYQQEWTP
jgi:hypothetical protein